MNSNTNSNTQWDDSFDIQIDDGSDTSNLSLSIFDSDDDYSSSAIGAIGTSYNSGTVTGAVGPQGYGGPIYSISGTGGGGSSSYNMSITTTSSPSIYTISGIDDYGSLVISTKDGRSIDVVQFIDSVTEQLGLIIPDKKLIEKYPALKEAYNEYKREVRKVFLESRPSLKDAVESYETIEAIVKIEENSPDEEEI